MRLPPRLMAALTTLTSSACAFAHEGHGPNGAHWHATDTGVFIALTIAVGVAMWLGNRK